MSVTLRWVTADGTTIPLDETEGIKVLRPVTGVDVAPVDLQEEARVAHDGAVLLRMRRPPRTFDLPIHVNTDVISVGAVARLFQPVELAPLVAGGAPRLLGGTLVAESAGGDRELTNVVYAGGMEGEWSATRGGIGQLTFQQFPLQLRAMDPWWYGPIQSELLDLSTSTAFDAAGTTFDSATTPFNGGGSTNLALPGDKFSHTLFIIDGPFTTLTLDGGDTGDTISLAAALADGDQITVDSTPGNLGPKLNGGAVTWSLLTPGSRPFNLHPPSDAVSVNATGTGGNSQVEVRWRNRYLTP